MRRITHLIWLALSLACGTALADGDIRWAPDITSARRAAAQFEVPLLIHFYGDNCLPCKTLEQRVLNQATVINTLNKYFICVRINASAERATAAEYHVHSWPTDVFVRPDGQVLYQGVCKQDVTGYMDVLQSVAVSNRDQNLMLAEQHKSKTESASLLDTNTPATSTRPLAALATHAQPNSASNQTLPQPALPSSQVQSGALSAVQQPTSIASSTPRDQLQIKAPHSSPLSSNREGLPLLSTRTNSLGANGYNSPNRDVLKGQANIPSVAQTAAHNAVQHSSENATAAMLVSNPYFKQDEPAYCSPDGKCYTATGELIAKAQPTTRQQPADIEKSQQETLVQSATNNLPSYPSMSSQQVAYTQPSNSNVLQPDVPSFQPKAGTLVSATSAHHEPVAASIPSAEAKLADLPAIDGYCPFALHSSGNWVPGNKAFAVRHRGRVYWMQNEAAAQQFIVAPDKYSPKLSGYDPMIFLEQGTLVEGSVQHGLHDGTSGGVFFFSTPETKQAFEADAERNARALAFLLQAAT